MKAQYLKIRLLFAASVLGNLGCAEALIEPSSLDPRFDKSGFVTFVQDGVSAQSSEVSAMASGLGVSLALTINAPPPSSSDGQQLYASDLKVAGNRVITAYNVPGNVQKGWVDLIDITTLAVPLRLDSKYFTDLDVNSLAISGSSFAFVGAKQDVGPVLRTGTLGLGLTINPTETALASYAGTGITYNGTGSALALTSGDTGGMSLYNAGTMANVANNAVSDARGVTYHAGTNRYYVVKGQTGQVLSFDVNGNPVASVSLGGATIPQSKATIVAGVTFLLATTGDGGFSVICPNDMKVAASAAQYVFPNYAAAGLPGPALTVSNAAAFGPGMIFVAAGQAGVRVYNFIRAAGASPTLCPNVQVSYMGHFQFDNVISANNLVYVNILTLPISYTGILYVAAGAGGFKAVTVTATRSALNDILDF